MYFHLPSDTISSLYADVLRQTTTLWNISSTVQQTEPAITYIGTINPQKLVDRTTWWDTFQIFQQSEPAIADTETTEAYKSVDRTLVTLRLNTFPTFQSEGFTTANITWEDFKGKIIQSWQRRKISERFDVLAQREDNWDGYDSKKPTQSTLDYAKDLMKELFDSITYDGYSWLTPFISSDEDGYITAVWHKGKRALHLDIEENEAEYTKIWGTSANMKIHIDSFKPNDYLTLWKWLLDE